MSDPFRLDGETALVTGGTSGIGAAVALLFRDRGAEVVVCGRNVDRGKAFEAETGIRFVAADVTSEVQVSAAIAACGRLSVLVNNAGPTDLLHTRSVDGPIGEMTPENWAKLLDATLTGAYLTTHHALPLLIAAGRSAIVNISSIAATQAMPGFDAYSAGKAGLEAMTRSLAAGYGHLGVRANAVRVGSIRVDHGDGERRRGVEPDPRPDAWRRPEPPKAGAPDDVAHAALYLASPASAYVTGVVLPVDGGLEMRSLMPWQTARPGD
ncbi:SDR family NAD(P)-dependent oxidoreductase [Sporichthya brevicatena]|uniref:SDR family NAD(P)-dependent oxidoreductase n=1 Tax=Sporichthya brevicatena TaxID=171442 RepID=A0ABN1GD79_9ACTN